MPLLNLPVLSRPSVFPGGRVLLAGGLILLAGCNLQHLHQSRLPPAEVSASEAVNDGPPTTPGKHYFRSSQYVFYSDFDLDRDLKLFEELSELRDQVYRELQLPPATTVIQVFLFENQDRYQQYMSYRYPELPARRAFFIAQPRSAGGVDELMVYTFWGDHILQDLRHELTHALLHSVLKNVPLWLDEGLAEFFETPPAHNGINRLHLRELRRAPFRPDLTRLEIIEDVKYMRQPEYREAWAWVHFMLRSQPATRQVLLNYLRDLRRSPRVEPLLPRLELLHPELNATLITHIRHLNLPDEVLRFHW